MYVRIWETSDVFVFVFLDRKAAFVPPEPGAEDTNGPRVPPLHLQTGRAAQ